MESITVGSVVRLKSGGPKMTVDLFHEGEARVKWFNNKGDTCEGYYRLEMLTLVKEEDNDIL